MQQCYKRTPIRKCDFFISTRLHGFSPVNVLYIFKTSFYKNISAGMLLYLHILLPLECCLVLTISEDLFSQNKYIVERIQVLYLFNNQKKFRQSLIIFNSLIKLFSSCWKRQNYPPTEASIKFICIKYRKFIPLPPSSLAYTFDDPLPNHLRAFFFFIRVNLVQKIKIINLSWNFMPRLIRICRIQWWCTVSPFSTGHTFFGQIWYKISKLSV